MRGLIFALCLIFCPALYAVDVHIVGKSATIVGTETEVSDFGLLYLYRLNPQIMSNVEGRKAVAQVGHQASSGRVYLCAQKGIWLDTLYSVAREQKANILYK